MSTDDHLHSIDVLSIIHAAYFDFSSYKLPNTGQLLFVIMLVLGSNLLSTLTVYYESYAGLIPPIRKKIFPKPSQLTEDIHKIMSDRYFKIKESSWSYSWTACLKAISKVLGMILMNVNMANHPFINWLIIAVDFLCDWCLMYIDPEMAFISKPHC